MSPDLREQAARICDETARWLRGERGPVRTADQGLLAEGSDDAFGVAAAVIDAVTASFLAGVGRKKISGDLVCTTAAELLRRGWRPGDAMLSRSVAPGAAS